MGGESEPGCYLILNTGCPPAWHIMLSIPTFYPLKKYLDFASYSDTLKLIITTTLTAVQKS